MSYDVVVIGGGAAGLSAAVNAASEGLKTLVLDSDQRFGGQAGSSTLIENYAGFAGGVTGEDLTSAMVQQALKFKATLQAPVRVCGIKRVDPLDRLAVIADDGEEYITKSIILATGVQYRKIDADGVTEYLGRGVSYGSPSLSDDYDNKEVFIIGGANSAGQAALHLSLCENCVIHLLIRGDDIRAKMSEYLVERIEKTPNIHVHTKSELQRVLGNDRVESVVVREKGDKWSAKADHIFVMIGAMPKLGWLDGDVERDDKGFIMTGNDVFHDTAALHQHRTYPHESSLQGLFVAGDIRHGSVKRCASAVGEGAIAVSEIHQYLTGVK